MIGGGGGHTFEMIAQMKAILAFLKKRVILKLLKKTRYFPAKPMSILNNLQMKI
jgi:hypothetical protein